MPDALYRWHGFGYGSRGGSWPKAPKARRKAQKARRGGITTKQAAFLAALQRQAGVPYTGKGMMRQAAGREIDKMKARASDRRRPI